MNKRQKECIADLDIPEHWVDKHHPREECARYYIPDAGPHGSGMSVTINHPSFNDHGYASHQFELWGAASYYDYETDYDGSTCCDTWQEVLEVIHDSRKLTSDEWRKFYFLITNGSSFEEVYEFMRSKASPVQIRKFMEKQS